MKSSEEAPTVKIMELQLNQHNLKKLMIRVNLLKQKHNKRKTIMMVIMHTFQKETIKTLIMRTPSQKRTTNKNKNPHLMRNH